MKGILGKKVGMTQLFTDHGIAIPVTVIEVQPNIVTNVLTQEKNSYDAIQLSVFDKKASRFNKPELGHFQKANTTPKKFVKEFRNFDGYKSGDVVDLSIFEAGEFVDVVGTSKGKGFAGTIKRYNQAIGPRSHGGGGGSKPIRQTGSIGDISGNKVVKGMTMPGHLGHERVTLQNLEIIKVDVENSILVVKGSIPGPKKSFVIIKSASKRSDKKEAVKLEMVEGGK
ncbi:50S ribosomal protein L3 [Mesomycoplasma conjunctivae]|uniref:Large ribosomal subunit protein uL3 n=1 Tax=Mesomycoplasma conjunctivae (strain ATCC 25834 / NCTC 10147 / HRC/581) TaxID=572263 RepID=C5J5T2_MESCH|nr:50S ribosomal protein L3 [Mesomycoplasma conjunctivae]CAT04821.1 50S ribosomal protein L3 [Mesomycoplasma conjunctivae]VEU65857.1 50S ribosomal protein L3 [Mesomycoplasma conjunctivae]